jgi:purine-binding chemotaxis protein CheW
MQTNFRAAAKHSGRALNRLAEALRTTGPHMSELEVQEVAHGQDAVALHDGTQRTELISFAIGDEQYGVDIMAVREIKGWSDITHLPRQPDYVRGVLNLRGVMVPIIDLRSRLGGGLTDATALHVVIIVQVQQRQVGLLADRVLDIVAFEAERVQPVPRVASGAGSDCLSGLVNAEAGMIALMDLEKLLANDADDTPAQAAA